MNQICAIMPIYGFPEMTEKCISQVKANAGMDIDILVIDDGSPEPYIDDSIEILRLDNNTGFTNATNQGILHCGDKYKYLLFINNDIFPEPNFVKALYDHMESDPITGIAGSVRWVMEEGHKEYLVYGLDLVRGNQGVLLECNDNTPVMYCDWFPTCSALVRAKMIREIGLLDKRFKQHCSDSEYCIRANHNNWNTAIIPRSRVEHKHQATMHYLGVDPAKDQKKFIEKIAGMQFQQLMNRLPLDCENNIWGKVSFKRYNKYDNRYKPAATK